MTRILVAEHDAQRARMIVDGLVAGGGKVRRVQSGADAVAYGPSADVIVINLDLPDLDGTEVVRRIRAVSPVPVIGTTRAISSLERVIALRSGVDVCLGPMTTGVEIAARVTTVMRRGNRPMSGPGVLTFGPLAIDVRQREVTVSAQPVTLTRKEFDLLHLLASNEGTLVDRREILHEVWQDESGWMQHSRTLDTHVNSLRRKLAAAGREIGIRNQRGVGFRFCHTSRAA